MNRVLLLASCVCVIACQVQRRYGYVANGDAREQTLPSQRAQVISADEAARVGLVGQPMVVPFASGASSMSLVADFLERADQRRVARVSGLAIILTGQGDGEALECRTEIVPETVTGSTWVPPRSELVRTMKPVTRTVTEWERQCSRSMRSEMRMVTEYEQRCEYVRKPVQRSRTVYRSAYDYYSKSYRQEPHTEYYTDYVTEQECRREPVSKLKTELVPDEDCRSVPVTRTVTQYELQYENKFVPGYLDTWSRQRLRELDPVCYAAEPGAGNRVEGVLHD